MQKVSFAFNRFRQENQLAAFSNIFAFCYRHKMQLGTADCGTRSFAFLAAGKKQMAIHNSYLLHLVIPSAFRAARKMQVVSFAFSPFRQENQLASFSNIFAFCYCHKMQLGTLDCGTRSFAFLVAGKKQMAIHNGYLLHLVIPSAFRAARKMQVVSFAFSRFRQETQLLSTMLSICVSVSRRNADNLRQSSKGVIAQTRLNQHEPSQGISGQVFSSLWTPETACPAWSQQMTTQRPGKLHLHFGQLPKFRWVVWYIQRRTPAQNWPWPAFLPDAIYLRFRQP